jgi:methionyl-tRNA formyltransferase
MSLKIVFMGTPDFAVPALEELIKRYEVCAVFTQPDKPKGRGQKLQYTVVKEIAVKHNISVFQPKKLRGDHECLEALKNIKPDLIIVIAYGQILPLEILEIPRLGCVNLHASLLPELRGAAPINWSIINGNKRTGNTTMLMAEGLDTGDMLLKSVVEIEDDDTAGTLHDKLSLDGVELLTKTIEGLKEGSITPEVQDHSKSSYACMMSKELGHINWKDDCDGIYNLIRGVNPWPGAYSYYNESVVKFFKVEKNRNNIEHTNYGEIIAITKNSIEVACSLGSIVIKELQEATGKKMDAAAYLNGHHMKVGEKFI